MPTYKGSVYWKDQCSFCKSYMCCKYRDSVELFMARLKVVGLQTTNVYGSLSFWCDYYQENHDMTEAKANECTQEAAE